MSKFGIIKTDSKWSRIELKEDSLLGKSNGYWRYKRHR